MSDKYNYFTIPFINTLKKPDGWTRDPDDEYRYSIIRCHFLLLGPFQLDGHPKKGEVVDVIATVKGATEEKVYSREHEVTITQVEESVEEQIKEEETVREFVASLSAGINADKLAKISSEIKESSKERLRNSFKNTFRAQISKSYKENKTVTFKLTIDPERYGTNANILITKAYTAWIYHLHLVFIDYLVIEYDTPPYAIKLRRYKRPPVVDGRHPNIARIDLPLARIRVWREMLNTLLPIDERYYQNEVEDPMEIITEPPTDMKKHPAKIPPKDTLYDISESVFPRKKWW